MGVVHGRFQPLHQGHMEYILKGKQKCDILIIGLANPDPLRTKYDPTNPVRSTISANPFTYYDRYIMVRNTLIEVGIEINEFHIAPFPINFPEHLKYYVPPEAVYYITIYDAWGIKKKKVLESLGYRVEVLWTRNVSDRFTTGEEIRKKILNNEEWKHLVPNAVYLYITQHKLDEKLKTVESTKHCLKD